MPGGVGIFGIDGRRQGSDDSKEQLLELNVGPGVAGLGCDERCNVLHTLNLGGSDQAILQRIDGDEPSRRPRRHAGEAVQGRRGHARGRFIQVVDHVGRFTRGQRHKVAIR